MTPAARRFILSSRKRPYSGAQTLAQLAASGLSYLDHRGLPLTYPEETAIAYYDSVYDGAAFVDFDVQKLSDGTLVVMHDTTVDRLTTSTGNVNSFDLAGWKALVMDAGTFLGGGWGNQSAPTFAELFNASANRRVFLSIEVKAIGDGTGEAILKFLQQRGTVKERVLINCADYTELTRFVADGWPVGLVLGVYTGTPTPATLVALGHQWAFAHYTTTTANLDTLRAVGLKVCVYTPNTYKDIQSLRTHTDSVCSDDAVYLRGSMRRTSAPFALQRWYHGQQKSNADGDGGGRGYFAAPDYWGYDMDASNTWVGALQGWASPMNGVNTADGTTKLNSVVIDFSVKFESAFATDRFAWIAINTNDEPIVSNIGGGTTCNGYQFTCRKNGTINIYRYDSGTPTNLANTTGTAIADGSTAIYRVTVTSTTVKIERLDVASSAVATDNTYRGAFLHAGVAGIHGLFKASDFNITFP